MCARVLSWQRLCLCAGLALFGGLTPALPAQQSELTQKPAQVTRYFLKKTRFSLPLNMSARERNQVRKVIIYGLDNANGKWVKLGECSPKQTRFDLDAHAEGEYWFTLGIVGERGEMMPSDPSASEYKVAVVVDMTPPVLDVEYLNTTRDGSLVRADVRDAHLDPSRTVLAFQTANLAWHVAKQVCFGSDRYIIPAEAALTGKVKVSAVDQADNHACQEFDLPQLAKGAPELQASPGSKNVPNPRPEPTEAGPKLPPVQENTITVTAPGKLLPPGADQVNDGATLFEVHYSGTTHDGYFIQVDVRDTRLDAGKTTFAYQTRNREWHELAPMTTQPGRFCIPIQAAITGVVKIGVFNQTEKVASQDFDLPRLKKASDQVLASFRSNNGQGSRFVDLPDPILEQPKSPSPLIPAASDASPVEPVQPQRIDVTPPTRIDVTPPTRIDLTPPTRIDLTPPTRIDVSSMRTADHVSDSGESIMRRLNGTSPAEVAPKVMPSDSQPVQTVVANMVSDSVNMRRKLVNQRQVMLDYQLEQVGPSGVGKVEIWITSDQGQTWQKLGEDTQPKSHVTVELPGEGLFGLTIVVTNGRGFGASAPRPGDAPQMLVEVDTTRPVAEIKSVRQSAEDSGAVHITWTASDRNMAANAVELFYASDLQGVWTPIAKGLRSDDHYRWVPAKTDTEVFIRLMARDMAGNVTVVTSPAFVVDDMSRPRGRLTGVVPVTPDIRLEPIDR